jgi:hypothetical protein
MKKGLHVMKKTVIMFICIALLATTCLSFVSCKSKDYEEAISLLESGQYEEAKAIFEEIGDYKDSQKYLSGFRYMVTGMTYQADGETGTITITLDSNNLPTRLSLQNGEINSAYVFVYGEGGRIVRDEILKSADDFGKSAEKGLETALNGLKIEFLGFSK